MMGIVALASMQAMKPTYVKNKQDDKNVTILITLEEWPMFNYFIDATIYYEDVYTERQVDLYAYKLPEPRENIEISLTGNQYIYISELEITLNGGTISHWTNQKELSEGKLENGYYCKPFHNNHFTIEGVPQTAKFKEDTEMYTLITNYYSDRLEGWYAFEKKYTYQYSQQQRIIIENKEVNKNALALYINESNEYSYEDINNETTSYLEIDITNNVYFYYDDTLYETNNIFYFSNVTINTDILQTYYNVYRIQHPEELNSRIVNRTINFETYNPLAFVNQSYGPGNIFTGWLTPTLNNQALTRVRRWFNGIAKYNGETVSDMLAWYSDGRAVSYVDKDGTIKTNNAPMGNCMVWMTSAGTGTEQKYTFLDGTIWWNSQYLKNFAWATYVNRFNSSGEIIGTADAGITETYTKSIYIAVSDNFKEEVFANNFKNVSYTTFSEGDVFSLITQGFRSWLQIFQFKIGTISIGTLLLAPLVVGFLVWLIHLVKRG